MLRHSDHRKEPINHAPQPNPSQNQPYNPLSTDSQHRPAHTLRPISWNYHKLNRQPSRRNRAIVLRTRMARVDRPLQTCGQRPRDANLLLVASTNLGIFATIEDAP